MKKLFIVLSIVLSLALAGTVMADQGGEPNNTHCQGVGNDNSPCDPGPSPSEPGPRDANLNLQFQADRGAYDYSWSSTGRRGNFNDHAEAWADGFAGGSLDVYANADGTHREIVFAGWKRICFFKIPIFKKVDVDNPASVDGFGTAESQGTAWTRTRDTGLTSTANAYAQTDGSAFTMGFAKGLQGSRESVESNVYVGGTVNQWNEAGETGYSSGQGVDGFNESGGYFMAQDHDYESGRGYAFDTNYIEGGMMTKGMTRVQIDPYGSNRSIKAHTENMVQVNANTHDAQVFGYGSVGGMSAKGNSYAGGNAGFSYMGNTYGTGKATLNANVNIGSTTSTVVVSAHADSVSNGGSPQ